MNPPDEKKPDAAILRSKAEADLAQRPVADAAALPAEDLLHELQVHQIELEMQNETLRQTQTALEEARDRYVDLYEFAPVGYLTLSAEGTIVEINLTSVKLLGVERRQLLLHPFVACVAHGDRDAWQRQFESIKQHGEPHSMDLALLRGDGTVFQAQIECAPPKVMRRGIPGGGAGGTALRIAMTDISRLKVNDAAQLQQIDELERFNRVAVGRELEMIGLKRQVNALSRQLGQTEPFNLDFAAAPDAETTPPLPASAEGA
jgi:PAS domain S-box-containing protein